jgi:hypothetical protein
MAKPNAKPESPMREKSLRLPGQGLDERLSDILRAALAYLFAAIASWVTKSTGSGLGGAAKQ